MRSSYSKAMEFFNKKTTRIAVTAGSAIACITTGLIENQKVQNTRGRVDKEEIKFNAAWTSGGVNIGADIMGLIPYTETMIAFCSKVGAKQWNCKQLLFVTAYSAMELCIVAYSIPLLSTKNTVFRSVAAAVNPTLSYLTRDIAGRFGIFTPNVEDTAAILPLPSRSDEKSTISIKPA
jgi:hypothetical protein